MMEVVSISNFTNRNSLKLVFENFEYVLEKKTDIKYIWACSFKTNKKFNCKMRIHATVVEANKCKILKIAATFHNHEKPQINNFHHEIAKCVSLDKFVNTSSIILKIHDSHNENAECLPSDGCLKGRI